MQIDTPLQLTGGCFINQQLSKLTRHLKGAKTAEDSEDVHQVRVACRRLRSAFDFFGDYFEADALKGWRKRLKKLMKAMGDARDLDVQIAFLEQVLAEIASEPEAVRPGIERMLLRWRQRREAAQPAVIQAIEKIQKTGVLGAIRRTLKGMPAETETEAEAIRTRITEPLAERLTDVLERRECLDQPEDDSGHHALRIAVKKLRYQMEISDLVLAGALKSRIKKMKKIQTLLGELHDCVVWESDIAAFIEQEKQRTQEYFGETEPFAELLPGLDTLARQRRDRHEQLFGKVRRTMKRLEREGFWEALLEPLRLNTADCPLSENSLDDKKDHS